MKIEKALLVLVVSWISCITAFAQDRSFPDPETTNPDELNAYLPAFTNQVWSSKDLGWTLRGGDGTGGAISAALGAWYEHRLPVDAKLPQRLARVSDVCLPLAERSKVLNEAEPFYKQQSYADGWWRCATKDWFAGGGATHLTPAQIDDLVFGQLDGTAPVRVHPEDEALLQLAESTSDATRARAASEDFLAHAGAWMDAQICNDVILSIWKKHLSACPQTAELWAELYQRSPAAALLVSRAMGEIIRDRQEAVFVAFLRLGMDRFPEKAARFIGGSLYRGTLEKPAAIGPDEACTWLRHMSKRPSWHPLYTSDALRYWVLGSPVFHGQAETGDVLAIGRLAGVIMSLYEDSQKALAVKYPGLSSEEPEFAIRVKKYEKMWEQSQQKPGKDH